MAKKKGRSTGARKANSKHLTAAGGSDEENGTCAGDDASSVHSFSTSTSSSSAYSSCVGGSSAEDLTKLDTLLEDDFDDKLDSLLDGLQSTKGSGAKLRLSHFTQLSKAMETRFCADFFEDRALTMQDILERALKRSSEEATAAATSLSSLMITMASSGDFCEHLFPALYDALHRHLLDHTLQASSRSACALALGLGTFITHYGTEVLQQVLVTLLSAALTPVRGAKDADSGAEPLYALKATALSVFTFLVTMASTSFVMATLRENVDRLIVCLQSPYLPLRVAAGQCLAVLLEQCQDEEDDDCLLDQQLDSIYEQLQVLATDSQKSRSKKELREQRSVFRQILATVQGDAFQTQSVTIARQETLSIGNWNDKLLYDTFTSVLGGGMRLHLSENPFLREIFDLGPIQLLTKATSKSTKLEKAYENASNRKARDQYRSKTRGKKADGQRWYD